MKFVQGQEVYIVENGNRTRKCKILRIESGFATIEFSNGALTRLRLSRLYQTEKEAKAAIPVYKTQEENTRNEQNPWQMQ